MKAIGYYTPGSIDRDDALLDLDIPAPVAGPRDLIVRVKAISVNPADTKFRAGATPLEGTARILGWDAAGVVEAVGSDVTLFAVGDEVFYAGDMTRPGANAQLHAVDERIVGRKPRTLDWAETAAMPLTSLTAWELLFDRLRVPYGEGRGEGTLLVINGAGGVGSILVQIARKLTGLKVIATASRRETIEWVQQMGCTPCDRPSQAARCGTGTDRHSRGRLCGEPGRERPLPADVPKDHRPPGPSRADRRSRAVRHRQAEAQVDNRLLGTDVHPRGVPDRRYGRPARDP
jgi:NADPH:quinone reductase-like Zn-dependent oxidoreductase